MELWMLLLLLSSCCSGGLGAGTNDRQVVLSAALCQHGDSVDCCWGWTRLTWGRCQPLCQPACKHGECVGPDTCNCYTGYTGRTCNQDVNECGLKPRPCKHRCMNTLGSYKCYCLNGHMLMPDGTCRNARTCAMANCQYGCEVLKGEVRCQCPSPGLRLGPDRRTCVDVDECVLGRERCPRGRKCFNTFGSYICKCHTGFHLRYINGKYQCTDENDRSICYNTKGSRKCKCKPGLMGRATTADPGNGQQHPYCTRNHDHHHYGNDSSNHNNYCYGNDTSNHDNYRYNNDSSNHVNCCYDNDHHKEANQENYNCHDNHHYDNNQPNNRNYHNYHRSDHYHCCHDNRHRDYHYASNHDNHRRNYRHRSAHHNLDPYDPAGASPTPGRTTTLDNHIQREVTHRQRGDVHIPRNHGQNNFFDLDFDIELGNIGEYARDDPGAGSLRCSFDQGLCSWLSDREGDLHWLTTEDPAGGRYLSVSEAGYRRSVRGARLSVLLGRREGGEEREREKKREGDLCLAFRHRLLGHHIGSLQLFVRKGRGHSPAIWTRTGGHGWRHTQITLWGRGLDSVVLKGERRRGRSGEVAVDDFSIQRGACNETKD